MLLYQVYFREGAEVMAFDVIGRDEAVKLSHDYRYGMDRIRRAYETIIALHDQMAELERENARLRAACQRARDTIANHRVPNTIAQAGIQIFLQMGPCLDHLDAVLGKEQGG